MGLIALCPRCRREILPAMPGPQLRGVHRGKIEKPDPATERKRTAKERRRERRAGITRVDVRTHGFLGVAKLYLKSKAEPTASIDEECPDCLKRQGRAA